MTDMEIVEFITKCYRDVLKREPDPEGLSHYLNEIKEKKISKDEIISDLKSSTEYSLLQPNIERKKH